jgi:hypothetical protein
MNQMKIMTKKILGRLRTSSRGSKSNTERSSIGFHWISKTK